MKKLGFAIIVIVLIVLGMRSRNSSPVETDAAPVINEISITPKKTVSESSNAVSPESPQAVENSVQNQPASEAVPQKLPDGAFEPRSPNIKDALEYLENRKTEDPSAEMGGMHSPDTESGDARMLLGKFINEADGIELITMTLPDDGLEHVCFRTPEVLFKAPFGNYSMRSDASGYGIVKFSESDYLRLIWSFEENRVIHGQLLKMKDGQPVVLKSFSATEVNRKSPIKFKYCK